MILVEDRTLLDGFRRGEAKALLAVYNRFVRDVARFLTGGFTFQSQGRNCVFRGFRGGYGIEAALQETFRRAFEQRARLAYDGLSPYRPYLLRIARNLVINDLKAKEPILFRYRSGSPVVLSVEDERDVESAPTPDRSPEEIAEAREVAKLVRAFKKCLDDRATAVFEARFEEGLSAEKTAAKLGLTRSKIRTTEARLKKRFLEHMHHAGYLQQYRAKGTDGVLTMLSFLAGGDRMSAACIGGRGRKLVDARFLRHLQEAERTQLEDHLAACAACRSRYQRAQLAERVAAHGPETALDAPSPAEIERVAADLGLLAPPAPRRTAWLPWLSVTAAAVATASLALVFLTSPPPSPGDGLTPRGAAARIDSVAFYLASKTAGFRAATPGSPVEANDHLKLRWASKDPRAIAEVHVVLVPVGGEARVATLPGPDGAQPVESLPGSVSLSGLPPGSLQVFVVAGEVTSAALEQAAEARKRGEPLDDLRAEGAVVVGRLDLEVPR